MSVRAHIVRRLLLVLAVVHFARSLAHPHAALQTKAAHGIRAVPSLSLTASASSTIIGVFGPIGAAAAETSATDSATSNPSTSHLSIGNKLPANPPKQTSPTPTTSTPTAGTTTTPTPVQAVQVSATDTRVAGTSDQAAVTDTLVSTAENQATLLGTPATSQENLAVSMPAGSQTQPAESQTASAGQSLPNSSGVVPSSTQSSDASSTPSPISNQPLWLGASSAQSLSRYTTLSTNAAGSVIILTETATVTAVTRSDYNSLSRYTITSTNAAGSIIVLTKTATVTSVTGSDHTESASAPSTSALEGNSLGRPISQASIIGLSIAAGMLGLGAVAFLAWRCIRKRTKHSALGYEKYMRESFGNDLWDGESPAGLHFGALVNQGDNAKRLAAARRAVLDTPTLVMQGERAPGATETPPASATLPSAPSPYDSAAPASALDSADAVDQDPYYNLLAWEMRRVRSEYIDGAPPTYATDPDSHEMTTPSEEEPLPAPIRLEPLRFTGSQ